MIWRSPSPPSDELLAQLKAHKAEIVALLRQEAEAPLPTIDQATVEKYEAAEAEYQRQLALLKADCARVYARQLELGCYAEIGPTYFGRKAETRSGPRF